MEALLPLAGMGLVHLARPGPSKRSIPADACDVCQAGAPKAAKPGDPIRKETSQAVRGDSGTKTALMPARRGPRSGRIDPVDQFGLRARRSARRAHPEPVEGSKRAGGLAAAGWESSLARRVAPSSSSQSRRRFSHRPGRRRRRFFLRDPPGASIRARPAAAHRARLSQGALHPPYPHATCGSGSACLP